MESIFLAQGVSVPAKTLCVDGLIVGASATYSHWVGAASPVELHHDLSTGILINAAKDPETYFSAYDYVANNHVDVDGILSMAIALDPSLSERADVLLSAAAYGDFNYYVSEAGARLALYLHQQVRRLRGQYDDAWERMACKELPGHIAEAIVLSQKPDKERDAQVQRIEAAIAAIEAGQIKITLDEHLCTVRTQHVHGHVANEVDSISVADDVPLWAVNTAVPPTAFLLLATCTENGSFVQLNAPTHSWAVTHDLPSVAWPDFTAAARQLQALEEKQSSAAAVSSASWKTLPHSQRADFTCVLALLDEQGKSVTSALDLAVIADVIRLYVR